MSGTSRGLSPLPDALFFENRNGTRRRRPESNPGAAGASVRAAQPYFSRRLLVTTVTLESAMAAAASMGESRPSAATGIPTAL